MPKSAKPVPEGYSTVTPYLIVAGAAKAIEYYKAVFGATERMRMDGGDGRIGHAELEIGNSVIMLADENPQTAVRGPVSGGGTPVSLALYVDDVDEVVQNAVAGGATVERDVEDQFYGDRTGTIVDPFGHRWHVMTHIEDVSAEEMERRALASAE